MNMNYISYISVDIQVWHMPYGSLTINFTKKMPTEIWTNGQLMVHCKNNGNFV